MYRRFLKRLLDILGSLILIIITLPIMIILYFLIKNKISKEPIFKQIRPGFNEKLFKIYKFKTMSDEKDKNGNLLSDELRLGKFGAKIRSTSLDELPQLFNVLKGDMSFIGPRPLLEKYLTLYSPKQRLRHSVRPGITGLAQVNGRNEISWKNKFRYDSFYASNLNFLLDLKILFLTIKKVIKKEGISKKGMISAEEFNGSN